jgi:hypothetical protein
VVHCSRFAIRNDRFASLTLCIEPEGVFFLLGKGEEVSVSDVFTTSPVTVKLTGSDDGPIVSIWPVAGEVRAEKDGVDVLDLLQQCVDV